MSGCAAPEDLVAYTKREFDCLSPQVADHIACCRQCAEQCRQITSHLSLYRNLPTFSSSPTTSWEKLRSQIETPPRPPFSWKKYSRVALILLALYVGWQFAFPGNQSLKFDHGMAQISASGVIAGQWEGKVENGARVDTFHDTTTAFSLSTEVSCHLGFDTSVVIHNASSLSLPKGELYLQVKPGHPLTIEAAKGKFEVLGTEFYLATGRRQTLLEVYRGTVRFTSGEGQRVVDGGHTLLIANGKPAATIPKAQLKPPWWVDIPFSIALKTEDPGYAAGEPIVVDLHFRNLSKHPLSFGFLQGSPPHLLLKVKNHNTSYTPFPLEALSGKDHLRVLPGKVFSLQADISKIVKSPGEYTLTVVFQGQADTRWKGWITSKPATIHVSKGQTK